MRVFIFFFFQAEDGIRDYKVTGVQTCALPISQKWGGVHRKMMRNRISASGPTWPVIAAQPSTGGMAPEALILFLIIDRKSTRLNSSHLVISYAVFCLKKKKRPTYIGRTQSHAR